MTVQPHSGTPAFEDDDWLLDEQFRSLKYRLNLPVISRMALPQHVDQTAAFAPQIAAPSNANVPNPAGGRPTPVRRRTSILAWSLMSLGLMAFVGGGVMLAWSFLGRRSDLWNLGIPFMLAGQIGLLLGLVLQLDHLWHANHRTAETLENVDRQLHEIKHSALHLRTSHGSASQSFYAHSAEGAHPHLLLTDLKRQLDLLANKLVQQR